MLEPDPAQAVEVTARVNARLQQALTHLIVDGLQQPAPPGGFPVLPAAHALQAALRVPALRQDLETVADLHDQYRAVLTPEGAAAGTVLNWETQDLSRCAWDLLQSAFADDIGLTTRLVAADPDAEQTFRTSYETARQILSQYMKPWWQEFDTLVTHILLAQGVSSHNTFGGASAFAAWGSILVNPSNRPDPFAVLMTLIHESSHLKLFGAYLDDAITLNDPDHRYGSPLRAEGRPMNGVFHAAFVLARLVIFLRDLFGSAAAMTALEPDSRSRIQTEMVRSIRGFNAAYEVIRDHGKLTDKGHAILAQANTAVQTVTPSIQ